MLEVTGLERNNVPCVFCSQRRIPHLFLDKESRFIQGFTIGSLKELQDRSSTCPFCQFITNICRTYIKAACVDRDPARNVSISIGPGYSIDCVIGSPPGYQGTMINSIGISSWIEEAPILRSSFRRQRKPRLEEDDISRRPENLRVIDVLEDRVVEAQRECDYLALSYVYGNVRSVNISASGSFQRDMMPATIRDAIIAFALDGADSHYGLPGVSKPRLGLMDKAPALSECIRGSKWSKRGWTLQESLYSSQSLILTNFGVYHVSKKTGCTRAESEAAPTVYDFTVMDNNFWQILEQYTPRDLTYQSDILHAFTAVLRATHGDRTYYGLPLECIDQAVSWIDDTDTTTRLSLPQKRDGFPSWSWTSPAGPMRHLLVGAGLALWAIPGDPTTADVAICKPAEGMRDTDGILWSRDHAYKATEAWLAGCIRKPISTRKWLCVPKPPTPRLPSSCWSFRILLQSMSHSLRVKAIARRWPTYAAFWNDAFGQQDPRVIFSRDDRKLATAAPGRILVHGQIAQFRLCSPSMANRNMQTHGRCIRSRNGAFVGYILSVMLHSLDPSIERLVNTVINEFTDDLPDSAYFRSLDQLRQGVYLNVMLIERVPGTSIARRVGIGHVFLESWVDEDPQFQPVVPE
ncbi:hypothetical protein BJX96DRAFT_166334 [Aspergillus floccosus]